jgi:hypothetical protein
MRAVPDPHDQRHAVECDVLSKSDFHCIDDFSSARLLPVDVRTSAILLRVCNSEHFMPNRNAVGSPIWTLKLCMK